MMKEQSERSTGRIHQIDINSYLRIPSSGKVAAILRELGLLLLLILFTGTVVAIVSYLNPIPVAPYAKPMFSNQSLNRIFPAWDAVAIIAFLSIVLGFTLRMIPLAWRLALLKWRRVSLNLRVEPREEFNVKGHPRLSQQIELYGLPAIEVIRRVNEVFNDATTPIQQTVRAPTVFSRAVLTSGILLSIFSLPVIFAPILGPYLKEGFNWLAPGIDRHLMLVAFGLAGIAGYSLVYYHRKLRHVSASELLKRDDRTAVLYLRPFGAENLQVLLDVKRSSGSWRFEEMLLDRFWQMGPMIAIGEPDEDLPTLGAARAYFADQTWQSAVKNWMADAKLIALLYGQAPSLLWELQQVIEQRLLGKFVLVMPPPQFKIASNIDSKILHDGIFALDRSNRNKFRESLQKAFSGTPWEMAIAQIDLTNALALHFADDGGVVVLNSAHPTKKDYELAIIFAIYGTFIADSNMA